MAFVLVHKLIIHGIYYCLEFPLISSTKFPRGIDPVGQGLVGIDADVLTEGPDVLSVGLSNVDCQEVDPVLEAVKNLMNTSNLLAERGSGP